MEDRRFYLNETDATEELTILRRNVGEHHEHRDRADVARTEGSPVEATVATASCATGDTVLVGTFVSTPITLARTFAASEQVRMVVGARQSERGDALQAVATLWVMEAGGDERCMIREDWTLDGTTLPSDDSESIGAYTSAGECNGVELQPGDRVVAEIGYRCTSSAAVEAAISRGAPAQP